MSNARKIKELELKRIEILAEQSLLSRQLDALQAAFTQKMQEAQSNLREINALKAADKAERVARKAAEAERTARIEEAARKAEDDDDDIDLDELMRF